MEYKYNFVLKFLGQINDGLITVTIPRADTTLEEPAVSTLMDELIAADVIVTKAGKPVSVKSANRIGIAISPMVP